MHNNSDNSFLSVQAKNPETVNCPETVAHRLGQLEWSWLQWQLGDWDSLASITLEKIQNHPDRGKLALLAAAGHAQTGHRELLRHFAHLALEWGCSKKLINQILIAGTYNCLGRFAAANKQETEAVDYLEKSIRIGSPHSDNKLMLFARAATQFNTLTRTQQGLNLTEKSPLLERCSNAIQAINNDQLHHAWQLGQWDILADVDNAEMAMHENRAELALYCAAGHQQLDNIKGLQRCTRLALEWGCPKRQLRTLLLAGISNTLAILDILSEQYESAANNFTAALFIDSYQPSLNDIINRIQSQLANIKSIQHETVLHEICTHLKLREKPAITHDKPVR